MAEARTAGYTVTAFGRRRPLPDLISTNYQVRQAAERQAMNAGIQGLAADLFKVALIRLDAGLEEGGLASDLVLQVHDEVLVDVDPDEEDEVAALTEEALTGAADLVGAAQGGHGLGLLVGRGQGGLTRADARPASAPAAAPDRSGATGRVPLTPGHNGVAPTFTAAPLDGARRSVRKASYLPSCPILTSYPRAPPSCPPRPWAPSTRTGSTSPVR